jgi:hypothetical protein
MSDDTVATDELLHCYSKSYFAFFLIKFHRLILRALCRNNFRTHIVLHFLSCTTHKGFPASHPILSLNQHNFELPGELLKAAFDSTVPLYSPAEQSSFVLYNTHCNENPVYVLQEKELRGLCPNSYIQMCLWAIYIFPRSLHIFGCSKIGRLRYR